MCCSHSSVLAGPALGSSKFSQAWLLQFSFSSSALYFSQVLYSKSFLTLVGFVAGQNKFMSYEYNSIFMLQASQKEWSKTKL